MKVVFWGVRGSGPMAGREYLCFGGNTSCVSVEWKDGLVIFDAGTGIIKLGEKLEQRRFVGEVHLFLSHYHLDHICGLPLFAPVFNPEVKIHIYGNAEEAGSVQSCVSQVLSPPYWPVGPDTYDAQIFWHDLLPGKEKAMVVEVPGKESDTAEEGWGSGIKTAATGKNSGWQVQVLRAVHPDGGVIYRLEAEGRSVVYGLDCEMPEDFQPVYAAFARRADLLIFDAAYTEEEYPKVKGFGHATWQQGAAMAERAEAAKTVFAHYRRERTDQELEVLEQMAGGQKQRICFGREGMEIVLQEVSGE